MRSQRGYSLIEVIAAFAVLTVIILVSLTAFLERNKRLAQANELIRAYQSLANEAEMQRNVPYDELESGTTFLSPTDVLAPMAPFTTKVDVSLRSPGVKNVSLIIQWKNGAKEAKLDLLRTDTGGSNLW